MGVFALTVNGVDRTSALEQESIAIREQLRARGATCEFQYRSVAGSPPKPEGGNEIVITNGASRVFAGRMLVPSFELTRDEYGRPVVTYRCQCTDYSWDLDRYHVYDRVTGSSKVYPSQPAGTTVIDLIVNFTDGTFTTNGVNAGLTIQNVEFDTPPLSECLDRLARETGYLWRVNYSKDLRFFVLEETQAPVATIDLDNDPRFYAVGGDLGDASQVKNVVYMKDVQLTDTETINEYFTGNGVAKYFPLSYPPSPRTADVTISAAGVGWVTRFDDQSGFTPTDGRSGTGTAYLCVFNRGLRLESALTAGTVFTASYKRTKPHLARLMDGASVAEMARREGLTGVLGIHEHVISAPQLVGESNESIERRLGTALLQYAWPRIRIGVRSKVDGWEIAQYAQVVSASLDINRRMYVQEVTKRVVDGQAGVWEFDLMLMDQLHGDS